MSNFELFFLCREELPTLLSLPKALRDTDSRHTLTSLSLLGKGESFRKKNFSFMTVILFLSLRVVMLSTN